MTPHGGSGTLVNPRWCQEQWPAASQWKRCLPPGRQSPSAKDFWQPCWQLEKMVPKIRQVPCGLRTGTQVGERTGQHSSVCHGRLLWWCPSHTLRHRRRDSIDCQHKDRTKELLWQKAKCCGGMSPLQQQGAKTVRSCWLFHSRPVEDCRRLQLWDLQRGVDQRQDCCWCGRRQLIRTASEQSKPHAARGRAAE